MNTIFTHVHHDSQQRLFEALRRISEENEEQMSFKAVSQNALDHSALYSDEPLLSDSGFVSPTSKDDRSDLTGLALEFQDTSDTSLSFDPLSIVSYDERLQVDRNGTRVAENATETSLLPMSLLSGLSTSANMCTSSPIPCTKDSPARAAVFAAAVTAAMIMERPDGAGKRPRSTSPETVDEEIFDGDDTDENDMDEADDILTNPSPDISQSTFTFDSDSGSMGGSPRTVLPTRKIPQDILPPLGRNARFNQQASHPTTGRMSLGITVPRNSSRVTAHRASAQGKVPSVSDAQKCPSAEIDSSPSAILSRKRRAEAMERFRRKKAVRCYGRRVRYQIRKRIATTRPRVNGRFARRADAESKAKATTVAQ